MLQESYKVRRALLVAAFVLLAAMLLLPAAGGSAARSRAQDYTARIPSPGTAPPADPSAAGWTSAASGPASCVYYYTFNSSDVPKTICDLCIITSTLPLAYTEGLEHVYLTLNHADLGQLEVSLTAPNNTTVVLMDNVCAGTPPAGRIDLGRAGPPIGATCPPAANTTYLPSAPLPGVLDSSGTWTLTIADQVAGGTGTLSAWGIQVLRYCPPTPVPSTPTPIPCYLAPWGFGSTTCAPPGTYDYSFPFHAEWCTLPMTGNGTVSFEVAPSSSGPWTLWDQQARPVTFSYIFPVVTGTMTEVGIPPQYLWYRMAISIDFNGRVVSNEAPAAGVCGLGGSPTPPPPTATFPPIGPTITPVPSPSPTLPGTATPTPTFCVIQFADAPPGSTFYPYIQCLACRGIVGGYPCGGPGEPCPGPYFRPSNNVTRGQTSKIVAEAAGWSDPVPSTQQTFADVPPGSTFWVWIERLSTRGIIGGYPCGGPFEPCVAPANRPYFRPNNDVTRGQLSKIVAGAAGYSETPTAQTFQDVTPGSTFYLYVERMASRGIIGGYPCGGAFEPCVAPNNRPYFRPNNNATRGQMSKIAALAFFPNCSTPIRR